MKKETLFEIRNEIEELKRMIRNVSNQMQELRESIRGAPITTQVLPVSQPYVHPWWEYQRTGFIPCRNNLGGSVQAPTINFDKAGLGISGTEKAA
jgi:hypothetical protein